MSIIRVLSYPSCETLSLCAMNLGFAFTKRSIRVIAETLYRRSSKLQSTWMDGTFRAGGVRSVRGSKIIGYFIFQSFERLEKLESIY